MSSDSSSLFGDQMGPKSMSHLEQANDPILATESYIPQRQSNRTFGPGPVRYEFSSLAPESLASDNSRGAKASLPGINWPNGAWATQPQGTVNRLQQQLQSVLSDQVTPLRLAGHLSVLLVAAIILILSTIDIPDWNIALSTDRKSVV